MPSAVVNVYWTKRAAEDRNYWRRKDRKIATRIESLIADIQRAPFHGIGKPEPLRHEFSGYWSRRITAEHRLVYRVEAGVLYIASCRFHYTRK